LCTCQLNFKVYKTDVIFERLKTYSLSVAVFMYFKYGLYFMYNIHCDIPKYRNEMRYRLLKLTKFNKHIRDKLPIKQSVLYTVISLRKSSTDI